MFSGGEPTIHQQILGDDRPRAAGPIGTVNLNTNGIRLAHDKRFVAELGRRNTSKRPSTSTCSSTASTSARTLEIRGTDLRETKQQALDNCAEFGLTVTLVAAIERDLNDAELGDIIRFGMAHPAVRSVAFQPVTHSGRHLEFDPMTRLTQLRHHPRHRRPAAGLVPRLGLLPGAVLLPDLPQHHLPVRGLAGDDDSSCRSRA